MFFYFTYSILDSCLIQNILPMRYLNGKLKFDYCNDIVILYEKW